MQITKVTRKITNTYCKFVFKILLLFLLSYLCSSCLPGINKNVKKQKGSELESGTYTINDIAIDVISIEDLNENQIRNFNSSDVKELKYSISEFPKIYNYKYEYAIDTSDVISINLTDTDDIDGTYIVDPVGDLDLPFVGKLNVKTLHSLRQKKS